MKLVSIELPTITLWTVRIILCSLAAFIFYDIALDIEAGNIVRRGITYTLEDNSRSFYINLTKRFVIFAILVWFGTTGTKKKAASSNGN